MRGLTLCLLLAGCNEVLGNGNFGGPDARNACDARGLPSTTLTGTVTAPNQTLPIYNALVYVPTGQLAAIPDGASGPTCASGAPRVMAQSDAHGNFKLQDVPAGVDFPLVIQVGKWRRAVTVPAVAECTEAAVDPGLTHLPRTSAEGHIPRIALTTGSSDTLECVARDLGIADSEIGGGPGAPGRIRLYSGNGTKTMTSGPLLESITALLDPATMMTYDAVLIGCPGSVPGAGASAVGASAMFDFANRGGWLWLSHFAFPWLQVGPAPWSTLGTFLDTNKTLADGTSILIDQSSPRGQAFAAWSLATGLSSMSGRVSLQYGRTSCTAVDPASTQQILSLDPAGAEGMGVQMFAWQAAMGGRMVFSDVHVSGSAVGNNLSYPDECMSPPPAQEKAIAFELFDMPTCTN